MEQGKAINKTKVGTAECPFRRDAGSYYDMLPWMTCSKMPSLYLMRMRCVTWMRVENVGLGTRRNDGCI